MGKGRFQRCADVCFGAETRSLPWLSWILTLFLEKVAVQSWLQSGAIAVRECERSASRKMCPSMVGPDAARRKCVDAIDWMTAPFGNATTRSLDGSNGRSAGMSETRINVSVAPVSARVGMVFGLHDVGDGVEIKFDERTLLEMLCAFEITSMSPTHHGCPPGTWPGLGEFSMAGLKVTASASMCLQFAPLWPR